MPTATTRAAIVAVVPSDSIAVRCSELSAAASAVAAAPTTSAPISSNQGEIVRPESPCEGASAWSSTIGSGRNLGADLRVA